MNKFLKLACPPIILILLRKFQAFLSSLNGHNLFDGDDELFKKIIKDTSVYGEYGVGKSTDWVYSNTQAKIISVDSSLDWIKKSQSNKTDAKRIQLNWVDLGSIGRWGRPENYDKYENFPEYPKAIWNKGEKPDLVLIDGRFRVSCFLYSLLQADPGTKLVFDDYTNRPEYHVVEKLVTPQAICGRQALFVVPTEFDRQNTQALLDKFWLVMD